MTRIALVAGEASGDMLGAALIQALNQRFSGLEFYGIAGPKMLNPDGTLQASRRSFPTVGGTIVRRTPLRSLFPPLRWQKRHYLLDAPTDEPLEVDTMLGAFLLMRRTMLEQIGGWDAGYKLYVEDIDLSYRAMKAGWEVEALRSVGGSPGFWVGVVGALGVE